MKRITFAALVLGFSALLLSSCLNSDDDSDSVESNGCYISGVAFTYLRNHIIVKKTVEDTDSTYDYDSIYSYLASDYIFTIDQRNAQIYNRDSLPSGTLLNKTPLTVTYTGGAIYWRAVDAFDTDTWNSFSSGDTLDLSSPLHLKVTATDQSYRIYTIHANVHSMDGDTLRWSQMPGCDAFDENVEMKAFSLNDMPAVLVNDGSEIALYTPKNDKYEWQKNIVNGLPDDADVKTICMAGYWTGNPTYYLSCSNGDIYTSADGVIWTLSGISPESDVKIVGASDTVLYAVKTTMVAGSRSATLKSCNLNSTPLQFKNETLDDDIAGLPVDTTMWASYWQITSQDVRRLILMGTTADGKQHTTWTKSWATDLMWTGSQVEKETDESWMMYTRSWDDTERLPAMKNPQMMYYDGYLIAFGGKTADGKHSAMDSIYASRDNGLSWRIDKTMPVSSAVNSSYKDNMTSFFDGEALWIFTDKKVFRGMQGKLWYLRDDPEYDDD